MTSPYVNNPNDPNVPPMGAYPAQPYQPPVQQAPNGMALAALIVAIIGLLASPILFGGLFSVLGLILGIVALNKGKKMPPQVARKGMSIAAIVVSAIGLLVTIGLLVLLAQLGIFDMYQEAQNCQLLNDPDAQRACAERVAEEWAQKLEN